MNGKHLFKAASSLLILASVLTAEDAGKNSKAYACLPEKSTMTYTASTAFVTVHGESHAPACTVWVSPDTSRFQVRFRAPVESFHSGIKLRDHHAMKAVESDKFPLVEFVSESMAPKAGRFGPYQVKGNLTFHGITKPIEVTTIPEIKGGEAHVRGEFPLNLREYGVTPPSLLGTSVHDGISLKFDFAFTP